MKRRMYIPCPPKRNQVIVESVVVVAKIMRPVELEMTLVEICTLQDGFDLQREMLQEEIGDGDDVLAPLPFVVSAP